MTDDKRKNIRKMEDDELDGVTGGLSVFNRQSPNTGMYTPESKTVLSDVVGEGKAAGTGNLNGNPGLGTVSAYCPRCGKKTDHIVFHGGIGKCKECGLPLGKL